jgi:hypothetical protein
VYLFAHRDFLEIQQQDFVFNFAQVVILEKMEQIIVGQHAKQEVMQILQLIVVWLNVHKFKTYLNLEIGLAYHLVHLAIMQILTQHNVFKFVILPTVCLHILSLIHV